MRLYHGTLSLAATDLSNFLGCRHRTALEMECVAGTLRKPMVDDPLLELLRKRGIEHEAAHLGRLRAEGRTILDLTTRPDGEDPVDATFDAMRAGADVIYQGALRDHQWYGKPDLLIRVARPSALGDWSYEVHDTKLARDTRAGTILQLGLYSAMLALAQGAVPESFHVVTPDPLHRMHSFRVDDYSAYVRLVCAELASTATREAASIAAEYYPEPVEHCSICPWAGVCVRKRKHDDHLSLVAGITRLQRRELYDRDVRTLTALATLPLPIDFKPHRGSAESFERAREQARLQHESRGMEPPLYELRTMAAGKGLARLPEPSPGDVFLDLEGDNIAFEGGREYLFGLVTIGDGGAHEYHSYWGFNDHDERVSFEAVIDLIERNIAAHPEMHVYHYAPYEETAFKRLMGRYATREAELDSMLRAGRFVDLYAIVRESLRAGIERYSIKNLEPLYGYVRDVELPEARRELGHLVYALAIGEIESLPAEVRDTVEGYNRDDCVSTRLLRDWLEGVRRDAIASGSEVPRPSLAPAEASPELTAKQAATEALRRRLLEGIEGIPEPGSTQRGRWLLAHLLDFHRREEKAGWWRYFMLRESSEETLMDEPDAVVGLAHTGETDPVPRANTGKPTGGVIDCYTYPPQEMEIRGGDVLKHQSGVKFGDVKSVDRDQRIIAVKKGKAQIDVHPTSVFAHSFIPSDVIQDAIAAVAHTVCGAPSCEAANGIARALLLREPPRLTRGTFSQPEHADASDFAVDVVTRLDRTVLAIQGPPGSGKTYTGARMICALAAAGKRVGVLALSHKVITNLLTKVGEQAKDLGQHVRIAQKASGDDAVALPAFIDAIGDNDEAARRLADREAHVLGGTAWLWARPEMANSVDVLFVDEAGQLSLANAIGVSSAASSMVLLGDPQQLDQPQKGSHPDGVEVSALHHVLGEHETIPSDRGIFLRRTWRLCPAICDFTSQTFYESRLEPKPGLENQALVGLKELDGSGLWYLDVAHDGRTSASDEEVAAIQSLVARLLAPDAMWISESGARAQLALDDVLIVSPFNAQVSRLRDRLPAGARVGTVDKFQGQAAPVVIYSMATSSPEDAPRGMEFLYSLNRLNVATSRAKCAVIVVANARLYSPECKTPRQMRLANALCRYREMARPIAGT